MTPDGTTNSTIGAGGAGSPATPRSKAALPRQNADVYPIDAEFHSLLLLSPEKRLYQLPVDASSGDYRADLREIRERDEGYRKVINIAGEMAADSTQSSKVSLALLPIKDEPNSGFICCYLANSNRLSLAPGAAAAWRDTEAEQPKPANEPEPVASLLVARTAANGLLSRVELGTGTRWLVGEEYEAARALLAQGCVAGEVKTGNELVPLINLASLQPSSAPHAPALATVNPLGKVFAVGAPAPKNGVGHRPAHISGELILALAEGKAEGARLIPQAPRGQLARRNAAQAANIAVAILPAGEAGIPLDSAAGVASSQSPVIFFNALRLNVKNVWTVAEWSDQDQVDPLTNEPPPNLPFKAELPVRSSTRLFVAAAPGKICDVELANAPVVDRNFLGRNSEVWRLLRNGCLAGAVEADGANHQLINLAAFGGKLESVTLEPRAVLASTWDFKWPAGKRLRVKFAPLQDPHSYAPAVLTALKKKVQRLGSSWVYDDAGKRLVNLELCDFGDLGKGPAPDDYDILIDLSDLPAEIPGGESRPARTAALPFSEIGSYASRMPYGVPTIWLGFPKGIKGENGEAIARTKSAANEGTDLDGYFGSEAFAHIVLHEFGHALGLPHLHQSPDLRDPFVDETEASRQIAAHLGIAMSDEEVLEELKLRWSGPGAGGRTDWFDVIGQYAKFREQRDRYRAATTISALEAERGGASSGALEQDLVDWLAENSVMMGLPARVIYRGRPLSKVDYQPALGRIDRMWIEQLYPLKPQT